jgi:hypothetical protein
MIHGVDTSFLAAVEVNSHDERAACRARLQRLLKLEDWLNQVVFLVFGGFTFPK